MQQEIGQKNEGVKALIIGFILIIIVIAAIFLKSKLNDEEKEDSYDIPSSEETAVQKAVRISADDLSQKILDDSKTTFIIDIRKPEEFAMEHIIDSKNIPLEDLLGTVASLEKNAAYVIVDDSEKIESINSAAATLSDSEIKDIFYLEGGFFGWKTSYNRTISEGDPQSFTDQGKVSYMSSDDLKKAIDAKEDIYLLDVRKNGSYKDGHIAGAENIFLEDIEKMRKDIPYGKKIVVYDNDGLWAFKAAVRLFDLGILNVYAVSDGLNGWKNKSYETTKDIPIKAE